MERKLQERMIGAGVLVLALVLIGPLLLDGGRQPAVDTGTIPGQRSDELRVHTIDLRSGADAVTPAPVVPPPAAVPPAVSLPVVTEATAPAVVAEEVELPAAATPPGAATGPQPASAGPEEKPAAISQPARRPEPVPVPEAGSVVAGGRWLVQVGAFNQKDKAERLVANLRSKGFSPVLSSSTHAGSTLYRVRVGPASSREAATSLAGRLAAAGHPGQAVPQ